MRWATAALVAAMVILFMAAANEAYGTTRGPVPPGYRCHPVAYLKCWGPGTAPKPPVVVRVPRPAPMPR